MAPESEMKISPEAMSEIRKINQVVINSIYKYAVESANQYSRAIIDASDIAQALQKTIEELKAYLSSTTAQKK